MFTNGEVKVLLTGCYWKCLQDSRLILGLLLFYMEFVEDFSNNSLKKFPERLVYVKAVNLFVVGRYV